MKFFTPRFPRGAVGMGLAALLLAACNLPGVGGATPTASPPAEPSPAPPTEAPGVAMLLAGPESDAQWAAEAEAITRSYAESNGLIFERRAALTAPEAPAGLRVLVALPPHGGLAELAQALPEVRILALGGEAVEGANVEQVGLGGQSVQGAAFIAGYTAAVATEDWRVGVLYSPGEEALAAAFVAGAEYFCGSCVPVRPPYNEYPTQAAAAGAENWQAAADLLISEAVSTVYVTPGLEGAEVQGYFAGRGLLLIGAAPQAPDLGVGWLASVGGDPLAALKERLPAALAGEALPAATFSLADINAAYLSPARAAHIADVAADLAAGFIALPSDN